jgi:hypothetical protein
MKMVLSLFRRAESSWNAFWFESDGHRQMKLLRVSLGILLLFFYGIRTLDLQEFYSESGILSLETLHSIVEYRYRWSLHFFFPGDVALWLFHGIFLASLVTLILGIYPRVSAVVAYVLHVSFLHRNPAVAFGIDLIATYLLLNLTLASYRKPGAVRTWTDRLGSVAWRLCQLQVCIIYAYSGLEKLKGAYWWRGEAVWGVLANAQLARFDFTWVSQVPFLVLIATWLTLAWEIYFPVLIWQPFFRRIMLVIGLAVHGGIALTMNIPYFAGIMIVSYLTFLSAQEAQTVITRSVKISTSLTHLFRRPHSKKAQALDTLSEENVV